MSPETAAAVMAERSECAKIAEPPGSPYQLSGWEIAAAIRARPAPVVEPEKRAPVQGYPPGIPWSMHLRAYAAYRKEYGDQEALIDLDGRNCRGGFSTGELDLFVPGWRDELSEVTALRAEVTRLRAALADLQRAEA